MIFAFTKDAVTIFLTIPHLTELEVINEAGSLELLAVHHHQLWMEFSILELGIVRQCSETAHGLIIAEHLNRTDMLLHDLEHGLFRRHGWWFFEEQLNHERTTRSDRVFFIQILVENFFTHITSSSKCRVRNRTGITGPILLKKA